MPIFNATANISTPISNRHRLAYMRRDHKKVGHNGQRIRERRKAVKLSQKALGKIIGVTQPVISDWESGEHEILGPHLVKLVDALKTTTAYIMGDTDIPDQSPPIALRDIESWDDSTPIDQDTIVIPFMTEVKAAAGNGSSEVLEYEGPILKFSLHTMRKLGVTDPSKAVCATVSGHSMDGLINDGAAIGVDTGFTRVVDKKIYILDEDGEIRCKQLFNLKKGGLSVRSHNKEEYPPEDHGPEWRESIRIIGRVFWWSSVDGV